MNHKPAMTYNPNEIQGIFEASYHAAGLAVSAHRFGVLGVFAMVTENQAGRYTADVSGHDLWRMSAAQYRTYSVSGWVAEQILYSIQTGSQLHPKDLLCSFRSPRPSLLCKSEMEWTMNTPHKYIDRALQSSYRLLVSNWSHIAATGLHLAKFGILPNEVLARVLG
jgi:hypothetical protein